jgi:ABC-2 type transport system ATP-binding protein
VDRIIEVSDLRHDYDGRTALDGINFSVDHGEIFGLLGPNGSGKSTLFRILSTLLPPTSGNASILGMDVQRQFREVRKRIGVVFQSPSLDPWLTVKENLTHSGHLFGLTGPDLRRLIEEELTMMGVADRAADLVKTLSGGLRRRVELAKCVLHNPEVLILDEPGTGLDPGARRDFWDSLRHLQQTSGTTIILTTHFMDEAERCDRLVLLDQGKVVAEGTPTELKNRIGGQCVTLTADDPGPLAKSIADALGCKPIVADSAIRIESNEPAKLVADVMGRFGTSILSATISRPTLEDVFLQLTGRRFSVGEGDRP